MKIFNLTDRTPAFIEARKPKMIPIAGKNIPPGGCAEIPDHIRVGSFSGLIRRCMVSVDRLPQWYQDARRLEVDKKTKKTVETVKVVDEVSTAEK
jgi:hypothetical protein